MLHNYFLKKRLDAILVPINRKNSENIRANGKYPITIYAKIHCMELKNRKIVSPNKIVELSIPSFQFGDKYPKIRFGNKNKIIISTVEMAINEGKNLEKNNT